MAPPECATMTMRPQPCRSRPPIASAALARTVGGRTAPGARALAAAGTDPPGDPGEAVAEEPRPVRQLRRPHLGGPPRLGDDPGLRRMVARRGDLQLEEGERGAAERVLAAADRVHVEPVVASPIGEEPDPRTRPIQQRLGGLLGADPMDEHDSDPGGLRSCRTDLL